jgi:outer membrane protein
MRLAKTGNSTRMEIDMKKFLGLAALALAVAAPAAQAQAGDTGNWIVRARILNLDSANKDSTGLKLSVNDKTFPEFDISYFYTPNFAVELILTYPQKHDLRADGAKIGTLKHLPPTLLGQYHVTGLGALRPYVGAGLNLTLFSDTRLPAGVSIKKSSTGLALQVGADYALGGGWLLNADLKKVQIKTDVSAAGNKIGTFKVDPLLLSVGVGKRF